MTDYDVIVIGAGYGGVTVASLCAKAGQRVLLVDKNNRAGGKAMTVERSGYHFEMWPVFGTPANNSRFHQLVAELGIEKEAPLISPLPQTDGAYRSADGEWRGLGGPADQSEDPAGINRLKEVYGATDADLAGMAKLFGDVMGLPDDELDHYDDVGTLEWMRGYGLPESILTMLSTMLNLIFVAPVNRIPVSETVKTLRDLYTNTGGRYHGGGFGLVAELAAEYVATHEGTFMPKTRIAKILVEGGRATGIATTTGAEFRAPIVVSNAGIQPTVLKLASADNFPDEYVERVRRLEPGWGFVGLRYFLDAPVMKSGIATAYSDQSWWDDERFAAAKAGNWPDTQLVFMGTTTNYDPSLAPEGHQIVQLGTLGSPDPEASEMNDMAIAKAEEVVKQVWPEVYEHIIRREPYSTKQVSTLTRDAVVPGQGGECIGLSQVIGQCGRSKPDARTPLPGLYLTGCDAGGYGCGTHQAVDSGFNVTAMIGADIAAG